MKTPRQTFHTFRIVGRSHEHKELPFSPRPRPFTMFHLTRVVTTLGAIKQQMCSTKADSSKSVGDKFPQARMWIFVFFCWNSFFYKNNSKCSPIVRTRPHICLCLLERVPDGRHLPVANFSTPSSSFLWKFRDMCHRDFFETKENSKFIFWN